MVKFTEEVQQASMIAYTPLTVAEFTKAFRSVAMIAF
jgi:hypothetical protein